MHWAGQAVLQQRQATLAGYHAVHGIAAATMPVSIWPTVVSLIGAAAIAASFEFAMACGLIG